LSDEKIVALKKYGAWGEKVCMAKIYGYKRTTVLINPKGKIIKSGIMLKLKIMQKKY